MKAKNSLRTQKRKVLKFSESKVDGKDLKQDMPIMGKTVQAAGNSNYADPINVQNGKLYVMVERRPEKV
ncbi:MAG: hypothetical protein AB9861_06950 [Methanosarcina sp.]